MAAHRDWIPYRNSRGYEVMCCEGEHVSVAKLKADPGLDNSYLRRTIPPYPDPVFHISEVCHVTGESGLNGIFRVGGFQKYYQLDDNFLWWSVSVTKDDIADAEKNFLEKLFPGGQGHNQQPFLEKFTTSPAFQSKSRYGNFRFTFPLKTLLCMYKRQFCHNSSLVLRVLDTEIYKTEIMYSVLVHPGYLNCYSQYPRLPCHDDKVCGYFQGDMSWRCQAPSESHRQTLEVDREGCTVHVSSLESEVYNVWDHVAVAFHMEPDWILDVDRDQLYRSVSVCEVTEWNLLREPDRALSKRKASKILQDITSEHDLGHLHYY
ncbi:uncharacterized protein LOC118799151 [Colossoma macropomum]|uniref:uncharacterized protein LOC118799151 n=1 Tax=Colossoma macropomum TaxID=42526 RepID=UPI0018642717|nr:uncharacterized protein LOC118799151 [Colossoma macropomum]